MSHYDSNYSIRLGVIALFLFGSLYNFAFGFAKKQPSEDASSTVKVSSEAVWIAKPDGAQSCEPQSGVSLSAGAEELKNAHISVLDSKKGSDGKMHTEVCGAVKGTTNVYLIPREQLPSASLMGYQSLN